MTFAREGRRPEENSEAHARACRRVARSYRSLGGMFLQVVHSQRDSEQEFIGSI